MTCCPAVVTVVGSAVLLRLSPGVCVTATAAVSRGEVTGSPAGSVPVAGRLLKHIFWIDDLRRTASRNGGWEHGDPELKERVRLEWAKLSAFDGYNTKYIAQTPHDDVVRWAKKAGLVDIVKSEIPSAIVATKPA